ncbi:hypothetical protein ABMA27_001762 [Loxostege sticticalis]|uniref:Major facilitator superfamily (MFS) profile domain-containing protein n=1 Tax=Loxostege sticticalis TaxID=481309 RepID=A0ABR3HZL9_LOXSC
MDAVYKELSVKTEFEWKPFLRQLLVNSIAWMFYFMFGLSLGAPTVLIPQVRKEANSTEAINEDMASWISSVAGYMGMPWSIGLTISMYYFGRKKSYSFVALNSVAAFVVLYCSVDATQILISQILQGVTAASQTTTSVVIMTEYTSPKYRGIFSTTKTVTMFLGIWVANAIGMFFHWKNIGLLGILCSMYNFFAIFVIPESPYWLIKQEKLGECVASHRWLKGISDTSDRELNELMNTFDYNGNKKSKTTLDVIKKCFVSLQEPEVYKALAVSLLVVTTYYMCGKLVCTVYSIQILKKMTDNESAAYVGMLVLDAITICGMVIGCIMSKFFGQKVLLLTSLAGGSLFLYTISLYLFLVNLSLIFESMYISLGLLIAFSLAISCGTVMSLSIFGELLPLKARGFSVCIVSIFSKFTLGSVLKLSPYLFDSFGNHGGFLFYAIFSTVLFALMLKYLPETRNKTLHEISCGFKHKDIKELKHSEAIQLVPLRKK